MAKKKNIFIHPDRVEDLDKTWKDLELNKAKPEPTGYSTVCLLRNTPEARFPFRHSDVLLKRSFVERKMPTRAFIIFHDIRQDGVMLQPVKLEWMDRSHINHARRRRLSFLHLFGYVAPLTTTPPSQILALLGIHPLTSAYYCRLEEWRVKDQYDGEVLAYKIIPLSSFIPWRIR
jgi:hypothetical protein